MKYTIDQHVVNLERMLEEVWDFCDVCPAQADRIEAWDIMNPKGSTPQICNLCKRFINLIPKSKCPCEALDPSEALKRTHLALEEYHEKH